MAFLACLKKPKIRTTARRTAINKPSYPRKGGRDRSNEPRINERIRSPKVRVVTEDGQQLGVMSTREAMDRAKSVGLDLVEVAAQADPPVCRIIDYGKYKYQQAKMQKGQKKPTSKLKEIKLRLGTGQNDYLIKLSRAERFLADGNKVRMQLQFRGRENAHHNLGFDMMQRVVEDLKTMGNVDQEPKLNGRAITMVVSPLPERLRVRKFTAVIDDGSLDDDEEDDLDLDGEEVVSEISEETPVSRDEEES